MAVSVGDAVVELGLDTKKLDSGLSGVSRRLQQASQKWSRGMRIAGTAMVAAVAAVGIASLKMAADFDSAMREVNTMMLLSNEEFGEFSDQVQELAKRLGVDAVGAANALYQAISAGIPEENVLEFLEIATKAAIGGVTDTATAVDGLTTVINAFRLPISDAQRVADIMFSTVKAGKTTMEELSASMFNVAPIAATMGVKFEEVSAAIATMTKQGVPTAQATTQIRQAMVALMKPTTEMKDALDSLGYVSGEALIAERGLAGALDLLTEASGGSNEMLGRMFGSVEGLGAVLALTGENAEMFATDLEAMENAAGAATDAFDQMEQSTTRQFAKMIASLKDIAITIGKALMPTLQSIIKTVTPIAEAIGKWAEQNPKLVVTILAVVGGLGGLLLAGGFLLPMISSLIPMLPALGAAFTAMLGPIGWVAAAITALIAIGVLVWKNWDTIKEKARAIWDAIWNFFKSIWESITGVFKEHWDKILAILFPAIGLPILIARNWESIVGFVKDIWDRVIEWFKGVPERIGAVFAKVKDWILAPFRAAWKGIESGINWLIRQLNKISFDIPDWVPLIGGKHFGLDIPEITLPSFKDFEGIIPGIPGTPIPAVVHAGEFIGQGVGGDIINNFYISELVVREDADVPRIAEELKKLQDRTDRRVGLRGG